MSDSSFPVKSIVPVNTIQKVTLVECGYCEGSRPKTSLHEIRMSPKTLTAEAYERLMFAGWRRSKYLLYIQNKPEENCCPYFPIRLDATAFTMSKSQRHVLARWKKFLAHETDDFGVPISGPLPVVASEQVASTLSEVLRGIVTKFLGDKDSADVPLLESIKVLPNRDCQWTSRGLFSTNATVVLYHKHNVIRERFSDVESFATTISSELQKADIVHEQGLDVRVMTSGHIGFFDEHVVNAPRAKKIMLQPREFTMKAFKSSFDEEEFELFRKYQIAVHHDKPEDIDKDGSDWFWNSNLVYEKLPNGVVLPCGIDCFGTYHIQYRVDGKLLAVEIVDVLPHSVSSMYEIHDPDMKMDIGTVTALKEIEMIAGLREIIPQIKYYCLGYYIHSCQKMKYKSFFHPSELLCRQTGNWVPLDSKCLGLLDAGEAVSKPWVNIDPSSPLRATMTKEECLENLKRMEVINGDTRGTISEKEAKRLVSFFLVLFQLSGPWFADAFCIDFSK